MPEVDAKFHVDKRVKWRTTRFRLLRESSNAVGRDGAFSSSAAASRKDIRGGNSNARFPGDDFSKSGPRLRRVARSLLILLFIAAGPGRGAARPAETLDFRASRCLGDTYKGCFSQLRIGDPSESGPTIFSFSTQRLPCVRSAELNREFIEKGRVEFGFTREFSPARSGEPSFREILVRHLAQAFLAEKRQMKVAASAPKRLVRTNVDVGFSRRCVVREWQASGQIRGALLISRLSG